MFESLIGVTSNRVKNRVERGAIKKFVEAIGDVHPIYVDEEFGLKSRYGKNIAPPTFPRVFDYGTIEGLVLPSKGLIHGEQVYHYKRPLMVDEVIYCYAKVVDYFEKKGNNGLMGFLVISNNGEDETGKSIFTSKQVVIITEAVRRL